MELKHKIETKWQEGMAFEAEVNDHIIRIDADETMGGKNIGPRPKPLLLVALAGCTSMDTISILKKMRIEPISFNVSVEGELTDEHPKYYNKLHILYEFKGKNLPLEKLQKAVDLSQERYCGISEMLRKSSEITYEIKYEEI